jgi:hypothetical protein
MRRLAIPLVLLLVLGLAIGAMGCGGNDEEEIRALVDKEIAALNDVDLETVYNQKTPSYKSRVSAEEYEAFILVAYADFLPLVESGQAEVEVTDVEIDVEGEWAYMTGKLGLNGMVLLEYTDESPDIWHKIDGTWYDVEENPLDPGYDPNDLPQ